MREPEGVNLDPRTGTGVPAPEPCYTPATPAVILAGGWGRRLAPATTAVPKALLPVGGVPLVERIAHELADAGIQELHVIFREGQTSVVDHFPGGAAQSEGSRELATARRPAGADPVLVHFHPTTESSPGASLLKLSAVLAGRDFVLTVVDELVEDPASLHLALSQANRASGHTAVTVHDRQQAAPDRLLIRRVTRPAEPSPAVGAPAEGGVRMIGRYFCTARLLEELRRLPAGEGGDHDLSSAFDRLAREGALVGVSYRCHWWDCGQLAGYTAACIDAAFTRASLRDEVLAALGPSAETMAIRW